MALERAILKQLWALRSPADAALGGMLLFVSRPSRQVKSARPADRAESEFTGTTDTMVAQYVGRCLRYTRLTSGRRVDQVE